MSTTDNDSNEVLPARLSRWERHMAHADAGLHPEITEEADFEDVVEKGYYDANRTEHLPHGVFFSDVEALIRFVEKDGRCPVCGDVGSLSVEGVTDRSLRDEPSYPFVRFIDNRESEAAEKMKEKKIHAIVCKSGHKGIFVGAASRSAAEEYHEWLSTRSERNSLKSAASSIARRKRYPNDRFGTSYSKGAYIAAIYELLGADDYDPRDLIGRENVTKAHLMAIVDRLTTVNVSERGDIDGDDWMVHREFGINAGDVEWHIPEWVDADDLYWDPERKRVFDYD